MANEVLETKGRREPIRGLIGQAKYQAKLAREPDVSERLAKKGWSPERTAAFETDVAALEAQYTARAAGRTVSKKTTVTESEARTNAKAFKATLTLAFTDLTSEDAAFGKSLPVTADALEVGRRIGQNTSVLADYFSRVRDSAALVATQLAPYFEAADAKAFLEKFDAVKADLDAAQATQEVSIRMLPAATRAFLELKGRVLLGIESLNRRGKIAFAGDATKVALFNKDLLLLARKTETDTGEGEGDPQI